MTTKILTHRTITAALLCAVLALAGCSPTRTIDRPDVVWAGGEPAGPLEDSLWVQTVRASELELAVSHYLLNFNTPELRETTSTERITDYKMWLAGQVKDEHWPFPPGPDPMIPVYVREARDGQSADVWICTAFEWEVNADQPEPPANPLGIFLQKEVTLDDQNYIVSSHKGPPADPDSFPELAEAFAAHEDPREDSQCLLDDAAVGMFDPPPNLNVQYSNEDFEW